jgi:hypothetical protein
VLSSGAYGFQIEADIASRWLAVDGADAWPRLTVEIRPDPKPLDEWCHEAPGGMVWLDRARMRAVVPLPDGAETDDVVHPGLTVAAYLGARARNEEAIHGGAVAHDGGAWVLLGDHERGKSTMVALLSVLGSQPVADDMIVLRGRRVCAGPRCLDLRPEAAAHLGVSAQVRSGTRRRMVLAPVAAEHPLRGFVHLAWGDRPQLRQLAGRGSLSRLIEFMGHLWRPDPAKLLELAELPHLELTRPRDLGRAEVSARLLQDAMSIEAQAA